MNQYNKQTLRQSMFIWPRTGSFINAFISLCPEQQQSCAASSQHRYAL
jgi:hypothetical protein